MPIDLLVTPVIVGTYYVGGTPVITPEPGAVVFNTSSPVIKVISGIQVLSTLFLSVIVTDLNGNTIYQITTQTAPLQFTNPNGDKMNWNVQLNTQLPDNNYVALTQVFQKSTNLPLKSTSSKFAVITGSSESEGHLYASVGDDEGNPIVVV